MKHNDAHTSHKLASFDCLYIYYYITHHISSLKSTRILDAVEITTQSHCTGKKNVCHFSYLYNSKCCENYFLSFYIAFCFVFHETRNKSKKTLWLLIINVISRQHILILQLTIPQKLFSSSCMHFTLK